MKRKRIYSPPLIALGAFIFFALVYIASLWIESLAESKRNDQQETLEQLEYHSQDGSHVVEIDGYIRIIRQ